MSVPELPNRGRPGRHEKHAKNLHTTYTTRKQTKAKVQYPVVEYWNPRLARGGNWLSHPAHRFRAFTFQYPGNEAMLDSLRYSLSDLRSRVPFLLSQF